VCLPSKVKGVGHSQATQRVRLSPQGRARADQNSEGPEAVREEFGFYLFFSCIAASHDFITGFMVVQQLLSCSSQKLGSYAETAT